MDLMDRIAQGGVILLDGAMGTELERRGVPVDATAWSAMAMIEHADAVRAVHRDFINAGAEIQIVNSFALGRQILEPAACLLVLNEVLAVDKTDTLLWVNQ